MFIKSCMKFLIKNYHIATIILISVFIAGYFSAKQLDVMGNPNIDLGLVLIDVNYPGAQPQEVVDGVIMKVENAISDIDGIKYYTSQATEGSAEIYAHIKDGFNTETIKSEIKDKVDQINDFPKDADKPNVVIDRTGNSIAQFYFYGNIPDRQLKNLADDLKEKFKEIPGMPDVTVRGLNLKPEITVSLSRKKLQEYNISINDISSAIKNSSLNLSAGNIDSQSESFKVSVAGKKFDAQSFLNIPVKRENGVVVKLGQITTVKNILQNSQYILLINGLPGIHVDIGKNSNIPGNNIELANTAIKFFNQYRKTLPPSVKTQIYNNSQFISNNLNMLIEHGLLGLLFILIILWLFMGSRLSFLIALAVPFSIAGALIMFNILGISINVTSMFGLLMVTGVVVDFGIVVAESIYVRHTQNESQEEAAVNGAVYVFMPLLVALLCNILAFMPILFLGGMMGKFMVDIPKAVILTLSISFLQSFIILPVYLRKFKIQTTSDSKSFFSFTSKTRSAFNNFLHCIIDKNYSIIIKKIIFYRYPIAALCIFLFILLAGLFNGGIIKYVLMPRGGATNTMVDIKMPFGTPAQTENAIAKKVLDGWNKTVDKFSRTHGKNFYKTMFLWTGEGKIKASVYFDNAQKASFLNQLNQYWGKQVGVIPGAEESSFQVHRSVSMGDQIAFNLYGANLKDLYDASQILKQKLSEYKGVKNIYTSYSFGKRKLAITLKALAEQLGLSTGVIGSLIRNSFYHNEAVKIQKSKNEVNVNVSYDLNSSKDYVSNLFDMPIKYSEGKTVPLKNISDISIQSSPRMIYRKNGKSTIYVGAGVDQSVSNAVEIMSHLKNSFLPKLESQYNVSFTQEGEAAETASTFSTLEYAIPLSLLAMFFILVLIFKSYMQPLIVLTTIPMGVLGSFLGLYIMGLSFSMLAIFGIVAMSGIVINNSIVYVNEVNRCLKEKLSLMDSIGEAGKRRFRPILLTKMCTFSGLFPLMFVSGTTTQLIVPVAVTIAFGVLFTIFVTLLVLPCLIFIFNDIKRLVVYIWFLKNTTREEMEPAYNRDSIIKRK
ncbi:MAG TPA: efflux RND transporter permease subunit [Victivallales bacterium]|nr:efflux RND transporter permease subunit [Victivallales bacterium]